MAKTQKDKTLFPVENDKNAQYVITCGDSLTYTKTLADESVKLIVSSPPYNVGKSYEKQTSLEKYLDEQKPLLEELVRVLQLDGSLVWQVGNYINNFEVFPLDMYFYPIFKSLGLQLRNRIVWHFEHGLHATKRLSGRYEVLLWFTKTDDYTFNLDPIRVPAKYPGKRYYKGPKAGQISGNPLGKNPSDYWTIIEDEFNSGIIDIPNVKANHPEKTIHPCQFPIELIERCVLSMTNEDDWVYDPYGGVGSTVLAALLHNRKGMMVDKEEQYCKIAEERVEQFKNGTLRVRPLGKPIYVPTGKEKVSQRPAEWDSLFSDKEE